MAGQPVIPDVVPGLTRDLTANFTEDVDEAPDQVRRVVVFGSLPARHG